MKSTSPEALQHAAKRAEAEAYAEGIRKQVKQGTFSARQSATFADLWADFARFHIPTLRTSTALDYQTLSRLYLLPHFGTMKLAEIRVRTIETFKESLSSVPGAKSAGEEGSKRPLSARSVAKLLTLLGTVFRFAQRQELMDGNPAAAVRKPKAARHVPYMLDVAEIGRLREALDIPWQRLLVELTLTTGLRSGELRALSWDNVDLEGGRLHIAQSVNRAGEAGATKTETSVRTVPMPTYLLPQLKRWRLACPLSRAGHVFPGEPDALGERGAIDADVLLRNILHRALRRAGLPEIRFHDLRHMAASLMAEAGVSLKRAQEILGHASERTTLAIYTHTMRRQHDDTADLIAQKAGLRHHLRVRGTIGAKVTLLTLEKSRNLLKYWLPGWTRTNDQRINSG